jgi:cobalt-zinc-cadmium efflux system membrane fusion protein
MGDATILIVDDDDVLGQILTRVLSQQGYRVEHATDAAQALQLAQDHPPRLAMIDLCLPDQDGIELATKLRQQVGELPLILMTAYPLSLRESPERVGRFARVLTKPLNLQELRQSVDAALGGEPQQAAPSSPAEPPGPAVPPPSPGPRRSRARAAAVLVLAVVAVAGVLAGVHFLTRQVATSAEAGEQRFEAELVPGRPNTLRVPENVARALGIRIAEAHPATEPTPLVLRGSLDLDPNHLQHVHARFGGEVVELGKVAEGGGEFATVPRPVRFGDRVHKGDLLCVVWSKDLGEKKSELVDALSQLRTDKDTLDRLEELYKGGAVPEVQVRQARRAYESDLTAVSRAERTLRVWRVPEKEINAVREEAERIRQRGGKRDPDTERNWARVDVNAPFDGTVVEKNVTVGDIVDTTTDLFTVANLDVLAVWANAYEEDLPALHALPPDERRWTVRIPSDPAARPIAGSIDRIGPVLDPNQHTALVSGRVENPGHAFRAGQFVTATVELPPPAGVVVVPIAALVEDGEQSIVWVRPDPKKDEYVLRHVLVVQRREAVAYVRWLRPTWLLLSAASPPPAPLNLAAATLCGLPATEPEVRVVTSGNLLLKAKLDDLQSGKTGD